MKHGQKIPRLFWVCYTFALVLAPAARPVNAATLFVDTLGTVNQTVGSEFRLGIDAGPSGVNDAPPDPGLFPQFDTVVLDPYHPAWAPPSGSSKWISFENNYSPTPGGQAPGGDIANNSYIWYFNVFTLSGAIGPSTLDVLADDTVSVWVNGTQLATAGGPYSLGGPTYPTCYEASVGCLAATMGKFDIAPYLQSGQNVFAFQVFQRNGTGYGLNSHASITTHTPEPGTLAFMGTALGLVGFSRLLKRRRA